MKSRNLMYIAIGMICVVSIGIAIFVQLSPKENQGGTANTTGPSISESQNGKEEKDQETIKKEWNDLFTNTIDLHLYDTNGIEKLAADKEIVYSAYDMQKKEDGKYEINIHVPVINIKGEIAQSFNSTTQSIFANKAGEILKGTKVNTIYSIDYTAYMNDDILSVVIRSTLKEGNSAQRVMVQTYNYNVKQNKKVEIKDIIADRELKINSINSNIKKVIEQANKEAETLKASGYAVYTRDINQTMYQIENVSNFFLGPDGSLYLIYAYGNQNFTSEMDIIII